MERILKPAKYKYEVNHVITQAHIHVCAYLHNNSPKYEYSQTCTYGHLQVVVSCLQRPVLIRPMKIEK